MPKFRIVSKKTLSLRIIRFEYELLHINYH